MDLILSHVVPACRVDIEKRKQLGEEQYKKNTAHLLDFSAY